MKEREIYQYSDDHGCRFGDPLRILSLLTTACGGDLARVVNGAASPDPSISAKHQATLDFAVRAAFGLEQYDDKTATGMTMGEVADLLDDFFRWRDELKDGYARALADVQAWFGSGERSYKDFVGLWLNVPRTMYQHAAMAMVGSQAAGNNEQLDAIFADGIARFPAEVEDVMFEINAARAVAKSLSKGTP